MGTTEVRHTAFVVRIHSVAEMGLMSLDDDDGASAYLRPFLSIYTHRWPGTQKPNNMKSIVVLSRSG